MSRWREMMMDYGKIFGSDKSGASRAGGSDLFSITSDIRDKRRSDQQLRLTLEEFVYGGEKIACHDLRRILHDPAYRERLPPGKVHELVDVADFNRGKAISYNEFMNIVLNQLPHDDIASLGSRNDLSSGSHGSGRYICDGEFLSEVCRNTALPEAIKEKMDDYRCLPPPFFMILISLAQIIVYVIANETEGVTFKAFEGVPSGNVLMYDPTRRREAWRWVSYCLLHQGYVDLIINVVLQLFLGIPLEMVFGWWRMAIVYISGVVLGCCGHSMADHYVGLVGAGGGSCAIAGAHLVALVLNWKYFSKSYGESTCKQIVCSLVLRISLILLIVMSQIGLAVYRRWYIDDISMKIGIAAHIGGLLAGAMMGDAFLTDPGRSPMKYGAALLVLFVFLFVMGITVILNIAWFDYPDQVYS